jgi:hypothetical protein
MGLVVKEKKGFFKKNIVKEGIVHIVHLDGELFAIHSENVSFYEI